jgi:Helix-turn-helix domain
MIFPLHIVRWSGPVDNGKRLRTPAAAEYLGVSASTMAKQRMTGDGPPFAKLGKIVVYDTCDLDRYVEAHRRRSTSDPGPIRPKPVATPPQRNARRKGGRQVGR